MARTISGFRHNISIVSVIQSCAVLFAAVSLTACVSTEELYAEYDDLDCPVRIDATQQQPTIVEVATKTSFRWEQAVHFEFDDVSLNQQAKKLLDRDVAVLIRFPSLHVSLQGFADRKGPEKYNDELSARRAAAVAAYLEERGIVENRIVQSGRGEGLPSIVADDDTARQRNRRVELMLLDAQRKPIPLLLDADLVAKTKPKIATTPRSPAAPVTTLPTTVPALAIPPAKSKLPEDGAAVNETALPTAPLSGAAGSNRVKPVPADTVSNSIAPVPEKPSNTIPRNY